MGHTQQERSQIAHPQTCRGLILGWSGRTLHVRTEMGLMDVDPHEIAVIPRGIRFQVSPPLLRTAMKAWRLRVLILGGCECVCRCRCRARLVAMCSRSIRATSSSHSSDPSVGCVHDIHVTAIPPSCCLPCSFHFH